MCIYISFKLGLLVLSQKNLVLDLADIRDYLITEHLHKNLNQAMFKKLSYFYVVHFFQISLLLAINDVHTQKEEEIMGLHKSWLTYL